jgi:hypothetical protein
MVPPAACGYCLPAPQPGVVPPAVIVSTDALPPPPGVVLPACSVGVLWRRQAVRGTPPRVLAQAPGEPGYCRWYCSGGGEGGAAVGVSCGCADVCAAVHRAGWGLQCGWRALPAVRGWYRGVGVGGAWHRIHHPEERAAATAAWQKRGTSAGSGRAARPCSRHLGARSRAPALPAPQGKKSRPCPPRRRTPWRPPQPRRGRRLGGPQGSWWTPRRPGRPRTPR